MTNARTEARTEAREDLRRRLTAMPGVTEGYLHSPSIRAFKVGGVTFAVTGVDDVPLSVTLKGSPDENEADRAEYRAIRPGRHVNKLWWNTIPLNGTVPDGVLDEMIEAAYTHVRRGLSRAARAALLSARPEEMP